jgi:hypothetical protein
MPGNRRPKGSHANRAGSRTTVTASPIAAGVQREGAQADERVAQQGDPPSQRVSAGLLHLGLVEAKGGITVGIRPSMYSETTVTSSRHAISSCALIAGTPFAIGWSSPVVPALQL